MNHPSDLALEEHLLDRTKHADHIGGCARCKDRLARMEEQGQDFRQYVFPATLEALEKPRRRAWGWLLAPAGALAAAAVVLIARPGADYVGTKGGALKLSIYASDASGTRAVGSGDAVSASASLRFRVQTSAPCVLTLVSLDDQGQVSTIYDATQISGDQALPGGARLDGRPGQERFFAVCTRERVAGLADKVRAAGVSGSGRLAGLPAGTTQADLHLEKKP